MIVDFDDAWPGHDAGRRLNQLKDLNPAFKVTLFAVPGRCTPKWCEALPDWIELAVHGWMHPDPYECQDWKARDMWRVAHSNLVKEFFVNGFKAPGWQISNACYHYLLEKGWWVADQHLEDGRRPEGLRTYFYEDGPDRWHGHVQNVCGNGIEETWPELSRRVAEADEFHFCSEALSLGRHPVAA